MQELASQHDWPFVSIVVPIYNGELFLPNLLKSLQALDYPSDRLEIILVNNNSSDRTAEILATTAFKVIFERTPGAGTARNSGIQVAQGDFIAFTDADCIVDSSWVKDLVQGFSDSGVGAVAGTITPYSLNHPIERYEALRLHSPGHRPVHAFLPMAVTANVMYRSDVFQKVGLFQTRNYGEDTDLSWKMQTQTGYTINFLETGGLIQHQYRSDLRTFCRCQYNKASTLIALHKEWNLYIPSGRKELFRTLTSFLGFLPKVAVLSWKHGYSLKDSLWEAWLDILVAWNRFKGIRVGIQSSSAS